MIFFCSILFISLRPFMFPCLISREGHAARPDPSKEATLERPEDREDKFREIDWGKMRKMRADNWWGGTDPCSERGRSRGQMETLSLLGKTTLFCRCNVHPRRMQTASAFTCSPHLRCRCENIPIQSSPSLLTMLSEYWAVPSGSLPGMIFSS